MEKLDWVGRRALITGASAGLGVEFAKQLHAKGCNLVLVARREERLKQICQELNSVRPQSAEYKVIDLADLNSTQGLAQLTLLIRNSEIDVLINNAGFGSFGLFEELPLNSESEMVIANALAPLKLSHAAIPGMKRRKFGVIVFVSSIAGLQPLPFMSTYAATKAFNLHQALGLRYELRDSGIRVLAVCPGPTATEFQGVSRMPGGLTDIKRDSAEYVVRKAIKAVEGDRAVVVTGWRSQLIALLSRAVPIRLTTRLAARIMRDALPKGSKQ